MTTDGGRVGIDVVPDLSGFSNLLNGGIRNAITQLEGLGKEAGKLFGGGLGAGVALGGAAAGIALTDFAAKGVKAFADVTAEVRQFQRTSGESAQTSSKWVYAGREMGISVDTLSAAMFRFGKNIDEHTDKFAKWGVAAAKNKDGSISLTGTLLNAADAYGKLSSQNDRNTAAFDLLGKQGAALIPILQRGREGIQQFFDEAGKHGLVFDDKQLQQGRDFTLAVKNLHEAVTGLEVQFGQGLVPALTSVATGIAHVLDEVNQLTKPIGGIAGIVKNIVEAIPGVGPLVGVLAHLGGSGNTAAAGIADAAGATTDLSLASGVAETALKGLVSASEGVVSAQKSLEQAQDGVATAARNTQHAIEGVTKAQEGVVTAHQNAQRATEALTKAQFDLNALMQAGPVNADAVAQAQATVESSTRSLTSSTEALAAAEQNLQTILADAPDKLANATNAFKAADIALKEARLAQAQPGNPNDPYAGAKAKLAVDQAVEARKQAQEALTVAQQAGTQSDQAVIDAQRRIRDTTQSVTDATTAQQTAVEKLADAQAGDPAFDQKVADAKQRVADAANAVTTAQHGERDAAWALRDAQQAVVDAKQGQVDAAAAVVDATHKVRDAQYGLEDAFQKAKGSGADMNGVLDDLIAKYPELAAVIQRFYSDVALARTTNGVAYREDNPNFVGPLPSRAPVYRDQVPNFVGPVASRPLPTRDRGGSVVPGEAYFIGGRPEILKDGQVYPLGPGQTPTPVPAAAAGPDLAALVAAIQQLAGRDVVLNINGREFARERQLVTSLSSYGSRYEHADSDDTE